MILLKRTGDASMFILISLVDDLLERVMTMNVDGRPSRGRPRTRWMDCVKDDIKRVSMEMTSYRREWKKKTCCAGNMMVDDVLIYL
jgi:hypothetical protein